MKAFLILMIGFAWAKAWAVTAPASTEEKPRIPADLYLEFKAIPQEDNAIMNWHRAEALQVPLEDAVKESLVYCWTPGARKPSGEQFEALGTWVRRDKEALELFEASLLKPLAQWPEQDPQKRQPEIAAFSYLMRARLFQADALAEEGKYEQAVESLEKSLKLAQRGIEGAAFSIQYMLCASGRTLTHGAVLRLASRRRLPLPLLERLLQDLPSIDSETNTYLKILRLQLTHDQDHSIDIREMAADWAKYRETNSALVIFPPGLRRPFRVLMDPSLVAMHPKPLDQVAELEDNIRVLRIYRTNCMSAWSNRNDSVQAEQNEIVEQLVKEIQPLMELVKDEPLPLSKQAAERARGAYLRIENPIGRILAGSSLRIQDSDIKVFRCRTEREACRTLLGLLIFERRKEVLPVKLSELVDGKILKTGSNDPFEGGPFHYSRERRMIWSVGEDGEDNGGQGNARSRWAGDDAVWKIPTIN